ncbi:MAG: MFS transporter [archaeon]
MNISNKIHFFTNRELSEVYVSYAIRALAFSMIGLFIPVFLLQMGYPLTEVFLFFFFTELFGIPFAFLSAKLAEHIGFKHTILLSVPVQILFFFLLFALNKSFISLWFVALIYGFAAMLFWMPFHFEFATNSDRKNRGMEFGILQSLSLTVVVIGPLTGAFIISKFSFNALFVIVSILLFLSTFPLFLSKDKKRPFKINFKKYFSKYRREANVFFSEGIMDNAHLILWPTFVFLILQGIFSLGIIGSLGGLFTAFVPVIIGRVADEMPKGKMMRLGAWFNAPVSILRGFFTPFGWLATWTALSGLTMAIFQVPFLSRFYNKAARRKYEQYIVFREFYLRLGRAFLFCVLIILLFFGVHWLYVFVIGFFMAAVAITICSKYAEAKT